MSKHQPSRRDAFFYHLLHGGAKLFLRCAYGFRSQSVRPAASTYLVYANHQTFLDPAMLGADFPRHMYFVSSEHVVRRRGGGLIMWIFNPILRTKAKTETATALDILRHLRQGRSVCVFIEGECTYDGLPMPIADSASHLAKLSGCALVTYRLHGGYFTQPRWGVGLRKGRMWGELVAEYSPEQLREMSQQQIQRQIEADLFIDSYAEQRREMIAYRGKTPAELLETALFICPRCGRIGTLKSLGDRFSCACGLDLRYDEYGFFRAGQTEPPFATVQEWFAWQKGQVADLANRNRPATEPLLADADQEVIRSGAERFLADLALYSDRLTLVRGDGETIVCPLAEIHELSCHERMRISFIHNGVLYELNSAYPRSGVKYQLLFRALKAL